MEWIQMVQDSVRGPAVVNTVTNNRNPRYLDLERSFQLFEEACML